MKHWPADKVERKPVASPAWMPILGSPGYWANSDGEIHSVDRVVRKTRATGVEYDSRLNGRRLKPWLAEAGYQYVSLGRAGGKALVHRLVCAAFHGSAPAGMEVAHYDGNMKNNRPGNLRWATHSENEQDKRRHGTYQRTRNFYCEGQARRGPKPSKHPCAVAIRELMDGGASVASIARLFGMSKSGMHGVVKNRLGNASI